MSFVVKPNLLNPQAEISPVFNLHTFYNNHQYVTISDLLNFANIYTSNIYKYIQIFSNGIQFYQSINGISDTVFSYVQYLPNLIFDLSNLSYDETNNSTNITESTYFSQTSIDTNCNIGSNLNVDSILSQKLLTNIIQTNDLSCTDLKINGKIYIDTICFIYLNNISLPLQKSNLISNFNINPITSFYFTLKNNYRIDITDIDNNILFSYTNITSDYIYYQMISFNLNMIKINLYNDKNVIII